MIGHFRIEGSQGQVLLSLTTEVVINNLIGLGTRHVGEVENEGTVRGNIKGHMGGPALVAQKLRRQSYVMIVRKWGTYEEIVQIGHVFARVLHDQS